MKKIIDGFNYKNLDDPEFLEDSVREEILLPLIKAMDYDVSSQNKIVRGRKLQHPYVFFGTIKKKINIVPDYILEVSGNPFWILEAKAPYENINNPEVIAQAYSYAIHQDVRAKFFLISNGKEFVLYDTAIYKPLLSFKIFDLNYMYEMLYQYLNPQNYENKYIHKLAKDFGLHLKRLNLIEHKFTFLDIKIPYIARINKNQYTISSSVPFGDVYLMTIDFGKLELEMLKDQIPLQAYEMLSGEFNDRIDQIMFDSPISLAIECKLGDEIEENDDEFFLPLRITRAINLSK